MGLYREQRVLMAVLGWCAIMHYTPPAFGVRRRKFVQCLYCLRSLLIIVCLPTVTWLRARDVSQKIHARNVSYLMWVIATTVETLVTVAVMLANAINVSQFGALINLLERVERSIQSKNTAGHVYPPYRLAIRVLMILTVTYHFGLLLQNYNIGITVLLQVRFEVVIADLYAIQLVFSLLAMWRCARELRRMLRCAIASNRVSDVRAVLRLRDDLVRIVSLVNRCYGMFFLGCGASWAVSSTGILYFDFVLGGVFVLGRYELCLHAVMLIWKSSIIGGLLTVAGLVTQRVKEIMQAADRYPTNPSRNWPMAKILEKALLKGQYQDIRITVHGLCTIDNSMSYSVLCSILTYLVILVQFRQVDDKL